MNTDGADPRSIATEAAVSRGALSIALPALFLAAAWSLFADAIPRLNFADPFFALAIGIGGIASVSLNALFARLRAGTLSRQRALSLAIAAAYLVRAAVHPGDLPARLTPSLRFAACILSFAAEWVWAGTVFRLLADRETVMADMASRGRESIFHALREEGYLLKDAADGIGRAASLLGILAGALALLCLLPSLFGADPSIRSLAIAGTFLALREFTLALFRHYREEFSLAGMGLSNAFSYSKGRLAPGIAIIAAAALAAIAAVSAIGTVPTAWFFALLARLFAFLERRAPPQTIPETFPDDGFGAGEAGMPPVLPEAGEPLFDPRIVYAVLKYAALTALSCAAFWFLFGPFFKRGFRDFFAEGEAFRYLRALAAAVRRFLRSFVRSVAAVFLSGFGFRSARGSFAPGEKSRAFRESALKREKNARSPEKKAEIGRLTAVFARVIEFGSEAGADWQTHEAPLEYAARLGRILAGKEGDLIEAGRLYEKALYAKGTLSAGEEAAFLACVERATEGSNR